MYARVVGQCPVQQRLRRAHDRQIPKIFKSSLVAEKTGVKW